jgi:hypothetical protein
MINLPDGAASAVMGTVITSSRQTIKHVRRIDFSIIVLPPHSSRNEYARALVRPVSNKRPTGRYFLRNITNGESKSQTSYVGTYIARNMKGDSEPERGIFI